METTKKAKEEMEVKFTTVARAGSQWDILQENFVRVDKQIKELEAERDILKKRIIPIFEARYGHRSYTEEELQRVLQVRQDLDQSFLKKALNKEEYAMVSMEVVSKDKLLAAVLINKIPASKIQGGIKTSEVDKLGVVKEK